MTISKKYVTDVQGHRRLLIEPPLGEGEQGRVYALEGGQLAAKVLFSKDVMQGRQLASQVQFVQRLDLERLRIARPRLLLDEPLGYVMERVQGKQALAKVLFPPTRHGDVRSFYVKTGGVARRYALLADLGRLLMGLHAQGLVYGDLSPNNIFVPEVIGATEVHLIDADNIRLATMPGRALYTRRYGAPEMVRGESNANMLTDAHAFSVVAFEYLTLQHPLIGDRTSQGTVEDEDLALEGRVKWIGDQAGENTSSHGVPLSAVLTPELHQLFAETFGPGLNDPYARPQMFDWVDALERAGRSVVTCPRCGLAGLIGQPAWCTHPAPPVVRLRCSPHDPRWDELMTSVTQGESSLAAVTPIPSAALHPRPVPRVISTFSVQKDAKTFLSERDLGVGISEAPIVGLWLADSDRGLRLHIGALKEASLFLRREKPEDDGTYKSQRVRPEEVEAKIKMLEGRSNWALHIGQLNREHYVARFDFFPGTE